MNLIVAVYADWGIGYKGTQPIVIPEDRVHFKELTAGATVVVGRRTMADFPSGEPLPGRKNIILSQSGNVQAAGAGIARSTAELFKMIATSDPEKVFVLGGAKIFEMLIPYCRYAYVTKIRATPQSDTFFPNLDNLENWVLDDPGKPFFNNGIEYAFQRYRNLAPFEMR